MTAQPAARARLSQVGKQYGQHWAVRDLNLELKPGELFAFLGPNGAGKTTTIKLLCGLLRPTLGTIEVGGFNLATHGLQARAQMSYVPDLPYCYEHLTAREFLELAADLHGMDQDYARARMDEVIRLFELDRFIDQLTERFSHGMRQRTVFAAAMLPEPKLLITDEPTVGLDPRSVRQLKDILRAHTAKGNTVFLSSHSLDVVEQLADRIGIILGGKLIGCGTLEELRGQAAHNGPLEDVFLKLTQPEEQPAGMDTP
jgi:ABC-2 type transport system ATP-binding protein